MSAAVDTGSSWTWFETDTCTTACSSGVFHYLTSNTNKLTTDQYTIVYGSQTNTGYSMFDTVATNSYKGYINFLSVSDEDTQGIKGILGLAPKDESAGPLIVHQLFQQGQIDKAEFSI